MVDSRQLEFPRTGKAVRWCVDVEATHRVTLDVELTSQGATAQLLGVWPDPPETALDRLYAPQEGAWWEWWDSPDLPKKDDSQEALAHGVQWTFDASVRRPVRLETPAAQPFGAFLDRPGLDPLLGEVVEHAERMLGPDNGGAATALLSIVDALNEVQQHLRSLVDTRAGEVAIPFSVWGGTRWQVYEWVANDSTGRIAQMAQVCPGLLTAAQALLAHNKAQTELLLAMIVHGKKLGRIVGAAAEFMTVKLGGGETQREAQRHRISKARACVPAYLLWAPDVRVIPEDIPNNDDQNISWFQIQDYVRREAVDVDPELREFMFLFTSVHNLGWYDGNVANLLHYLQATGRRPKRTVTREELSHDMQDWWARLDVNAAEEVPPATPLLPACFEGHDRWQASGVIIQRLQLAIDMTTESYAMEHCVATRAILGSDGRRQFFHGDIHGEQVTIEASWQAGQDRPRIHEARGVRNANLSSRAAAVLKHWVEALVNGIPRADGRCA